MYDRFFFPSLRGYRGLSREQLAHLAALEPHVLEAIERGERVPDAETRRRLGEALDWPLYPPEPHKQVPVQVGRQRAEIDELIAPLIQEMWLAGIKTLMSCQQGAYGLVWISFPTAKQVVKFLNIVMNYEGEEDGLYERMQGHEVEDEASLPEWRYQVWVRDYALLEDDEGNSCYDGPADCRLAINVRFPPHDLPTVLERLTRHNRTLGRSALSPGGCAGLRGARAGNRVLTAPGQT